MLNTSMYFAASFLAATVVPFSSESLLGVMVLGPFNPLHCLLAATSGNFLGGMTCYGLGRMTRWDWIERYLGIKRVKIEGLKPRILKHQNAAAFFTWVPIDGRD